MTKKWLLEGLIGCSECLKKNKHIALKIQAIRQVV